MMTSENNMAEKTITRLRSVGWDGSSCPDGWDCPSLLATNWGVKLTIGRLVTDPDVLRMLNLAADEVAIETPYELWEDAGTPPQISINRGMRVTIGRLVTDPDVLRMLNLAADEVAIETPNDQREDTP